MHVFDQEFRLPLISDHVGLLRHLEDGVRKFLPLGSFPIRFAVTRTDGSYYHCEVASLVTDATRARLNVPSPFDFAPRRIENAQQFNAVLVIPTGIGAEIGGHAGDGTAVARVLAGVCDALITHPNVVNASDINELPENGLYLEGSILCRLLMGTIGVQRVRANKTLVIVEHHPEEKIVHDVINSINAASAVYGFKPARIEILDPSFTTITGYAESGTAAGRIENLERLFDVIDSRPRDFDAIAISSVVDVSPETLVDYFSSEFDMVNPWGGVEAMLTHTVSSIYDVPSAHAPMMESSQVANLDLGIVDPRMAAEAASMTFLNCVLKGLQRSPRVVTDRLSMHLPGVMTAADVSCLVIPEGCLGLPTLAALEQGIPVIAVKENANLMKNDLTALPWSPGQFYQVENYWEAAGVMLALKAGIDPGTVRRPLKAARVVNHISDDQIETPVGPSKTRSSTDRVQGSI